LFDLMRQAPDWSLRAYARALEHSVRWVREWFERLMPYREAASYPPMSVFASRSRCPHRCPHRLPRDIVKLICQLRPQLSEQFNRPAGAKTIQAALRARLPSSMRIPSIRAIYNALRNSGALSPRPKVVHKPLVLPGPMEEWELDFGEIRLEPEEGQLEFLMVVDRGTSRRLPGRLFGLRC
jgi:hypothetical protein